MLGQFLVEDEVNFVVQFEKYSLKNVFFNIYIKVLLGNCNFFYFGQVVYNIFIFFIQIVNKGLLMRDVF